MGSSTEAEGDAVAGLRTIVYEMGKILRQSYSITERVSTCQQRGLACAPPQKLSKDSMDVLKITNIFRFDIDAGRASFIRAV
jgi:hypothetical protein